MLHALSGTEVRVQAAMIRPAIAAILALGAFAAMRSHAAGRAASAADVAGLEAMNAKDCTMARAADWSGFARTLAPEFVAIDVVGQRADRKTLLANLAATTGQATITACSTRTTRVTRDGDAYTLEGIYSEEGAQGPKHTGFRTVSRIRDSWKREGGAWLQTRSLTLEMSVWVDGKLVEHRVLPKQD